MKPTFAADALAGKVAIVTGAGSGIGRAIAVTFAQLGAHVLAVDIDSSGLAATLERATGDITAHEVDVTDAAQMENLFDRAERQHGKITTVVNNAAISLPGTVVEATVDEFDRTIAVNVRGVFLGCKLGVQAMLRGGGGSIINMGSVNSLVAERYLSSYCASKGAVLMLTKSVALDYAAHEIRVNCICPGWVDTPINLAHAERMGGIAAVRAALPTFQPIGREGQPSEIAALAVYLASDASAFLTGASLAIDGGMTAA
jgi:meso-butanediol dehydrogenase / (S,S)-butanediol dehydrogenase / diacetyl reductase